jgi:hypothetical protein
MRSDVLSVRVGWRGNWDRYPIGFDALASVLHRDRMQLEYGPIAPDVIRSNSKSARMW